MCEVRERMFIKGNEGGLTKVGCHLRGKERDDLQRLLKIRMGAKAS